MTTVQEVIDEFDDMTPTEVAVHLEREGIKGKRGVSVSCPLANYIGIRTGAVSVRVGEFSARTTWVDESSVRWSDFAWMTDVLGDFVFKFDSGHYPFLEENNA